MITLLFNKGDVLIVKRPGCRCPECRDSKETYVVIYDHAYRTHSAYEVFLVEPWGRVSLDREWPIFEFQDEEVIDKLEQATKEHNEFVEKLSNAVEKMQRDVSKYLAQIHIPTSEFRRLRDTIYSNWLDTFLQEVYQEYIELFAGKMD